MIKKWFFKFIELERGGHIILIVSALPTIFVWIFTREITSVGLFCLGLQLGLLFGAESTLWWRRRADLWSKRTMRYLEDSIRIREEMLKNPPILEVEDIWFEGFER